MDELREREALRKVRWDMLRSDIYIRDKGICWVCNAKVELREYDLGHLIDRCNGGADDYDNLAVMHKHCNITKPRHNTLEEAMKWKLTPKYLTTRPMAKVVKEQLSFISTPQALADTHKQTSTITIPRSRKEKIHPTISREDKDVMRQLVIEYFLNRPELLTKEHSTERAEAIKQLSTTLDCSPVFVRQWVRDTGKLPDKPPIYYDGRQYKYIKEHLDELIKQYDTLPIGCVRSKAMGISDYSIRILLCLAGRQDQVDEKSKISIFRKLDRLGMTS